ncbi:MAG: 2'-5' RNA ligase family protein, partial [Bacteroidota bacterium]
MSARSLLANQKNLTGDGSSVGLFIPLPKELADLYPDLSPHDSTPPHVTFLYVGAVGDEASFIEALRDSLSHFQGPVQAKADDLSVFDNRYQDGNLVYYSPVEFSSPLSEWRSAVIQDLIDQGLTIQDRSPHVYHPHVTLSYQPQPPYQGVIPDTVWWFSSVEVWGLSKVYTIPFGITFSARVASRFALARDVVSKYLSKTETDEGNTIYHYGPRQVAKRHKEKAERLSRLDENISKLKSKVRRDLSSKNEMTKLTAAAVSLINNIYERVGNDRSAANGHFGVTGLCRKHVNFDNYSANFSYTGKSGVKQKKKVTDTKLIAVLKDLVSDKDKEERIFSCSKGVCITSKDINSYLSRFDITAKDLRGYHANQEMLSALREKSGDSVDYKKEFKKALEQVAKTVGHSPAILRRDYLVPGLEDSYVKDGTVISLSAKKSSLPIL